MALHWAAAALQRVNALSGGWRATGRAPPGGAAPLPPARPPPQGHRHLLSALQAPSLLSWLPLLSLRLSIAGVSVTRLRVLLKALNWASLSVNAGACARVAAAAAGRHPPPAAAGGGAAPLASSGALLRPGRLLGGAQPAAEHLVVLAHVVCTGGEGGTREGGVSVSWAWAGLGQPTGAGGKVTAGCSTTPSTNVRQHHATYSVSQHGCPPAAQHPQWQPASMDASQHHGNQPASIRQSSMPASTHPSR